MASNLIAVASNLEAMASNLIASYMFIHMPCVKFRTEDIDRD